MKNPNENLKAGDSCIVIRDGEPVESTISKKVTVDEIDENGNVISSVRLFVALFGNSEPYIGKIYADKDSLLLEMNEALPD